MRQSYKMFLLLAEEQNFHRAAKRAFISQQGFSDHIQRLEKEYGTALFTRKPEIALTESGEAVLRFVRRLEVLEQGLGKELKEQIDGTVGTLRVGFNATRGHVLLPTILERYHRQYPKIKVVAITDETKNLEDMLEENKIDGFMGVNSAPRCDFLRVPLYEEKIHMLCTERYLHRHLDGALADSLESLRDGVDLRAFTEAPFALDLSYSKLRLPLEQHLEEHNITLPIVMEANENELRTHLCTTGAMAGFFPTIACKVNEWNTTTNRHDPVHAFTIKDLDHRVRVDWICHQENYFPVYVSDFFEIVRQESEKYLEEIQRYI